MVKKGKNISEEMSKEIRGFEELFSEYLKSEEAREKEKKDRESVKQSEIYELQAFLEQENERLTRLEIFFTKKLPALFNFSQAKKLFELQHDRRMVIKRKLSDELLKKESKFQKNLSQLFNSHFS